MIDQICRKLPIISPIDFEVEAAIDFFSAKNILDENSTANQKAQKMSN